MGEHAWRILGEQTWYIYVRLLTVGSLPRKYDTWVFRRLKGPRRGCGLALGKLSRMFTPALGWFAACVAERSGSESVCC